MRLFMETWVLGLIPVGMNKYVTISDVGMDSDVDMGTIPISE
jgi:hypothetical protein